MLVKEYYIIQNKEGKYFHIDNASGGYPCFLRDFENCEKYNSEQSVKNFLDSEYVTRMFKKEFEDCIVKTVKIFIE